MTRATWRRVRGKFMIGLMAFCVVVALLPLLFILGTLIVKGASSLSVDFFTRMSGEIFDRVTAKGLLASIVEGEAKEGPAFDKGVSAGRARRLSLGTLLFGARAQVVRGVLAKPDAASYIRGVLIGSEIADALGVYPTLSESVIPLIGNRALCHLYASALRTAGVSSELIESRAACLRGFRALHEIRHG